MLFSSFLFLILFLPGVLALYFAMPGIRTRNGVLVFASLLFYFWGEGAYIAVMLASVLIAWYFGNRIESTRSPRDRQLVATTGILLIVGLLVGFKYANFLVDNVNALQHAFGIAGTLRLAPVHLPIGISFFTFQVVSYLIDVYRGDVAAQPSLFKVALYKTFFPQLIAGPIVRYRDIKQSIDVRHTSADDFAEGAYRFVVGLAQKVLIANTVGQAADAIFRLPTGQLGVAAAWLAAICYTFQIYFDFAGYSNMAIGLGRIFGFRLLENFAHPYASQSITEFWRRWHISLSTWFRDYLYIPLGGSRGSQLRTYRNLFIVFFLCGLWHGASWTFIVWGLFHGSLLSAERAGMGRWLARIPALMRWTYTIGATIVGWVIFRCDTLGQGWLHLKAMFGFGSHTAFLTPLQQFVTPELGVALALAAFFSFPQSRFVPAWDHADAPTAWQVAYPYLAFVTCLTLSLVYLAGASFNPFIYFRF